MLSGKAVKLLVYEGLQFTALIVPVFVVMERFARVVREVGGRDVTAYWLVVAGSIAYVTSATLLVWVPLKYVILKKRRIVADITQWRPTMLAYLILSTLPCFTIVSAGLKIQIDSRLQRDQFTELPVSLVLLFLVFVDLIERIRPCRLIGKSDSLESDWDMSGPVLTHLVRVVTVSSHLTADEAQSDLTQLHLEARNGSTPVRRIEQPDPARPSPLSARTHTSTYPFSSSPRLVSYSGPLRVLWRRDLRSELFVETFLFWLDTVELLRVAAAPQVSRTDWMFPVYILSFLSAVRVVITPHSPLLSLTGVLLQDLPFFVMRVALIAGLGFVSPVFYLMKNLTVCLSYVYFTWVARLRLFSGRSMF